jgi:hypothetical protein
MEQINLSVRLDAEVAAHAQRHVIAGEEWAATAAGTVRAEVHSLISRKTTEHTIYRCPLILREEDYSRGAVVSIRYKYALDGMRLQIAKARLLHFVGQIQAEGWDTRSVVSAIEHDTLVDQMNVATRLVWAVQVQYAGSRTAHPPATGAYSTIIFTELLSRRSRAGIPGQCAT